MFTKILKRKNVEKKPTPSKTMPKNVKETPKKNDKSLSKKGTTETKDDGYVHHG